MLTRDDSMNNNNIQHRGFVRLGKVHIHAEPLDYVHSGTFLLPSQNYAQCQHLHKPVEKRKENYSIHYFFFQSSDFFQILAKPSYTSE